MPVTIRDVAAAAGVSLTTVSHTLHNRGRIGDETRKRVLTAAAELGYTANVHAQQLVTNRSRTLAIQIAPFDHFVPNSVIPNSEYFLEVLNGAAEEAEAHRYALILAPPSTTHDRIGAFAIDGAIIVDPHGDEGLLDSAWAETHPVVLAGRTSDDRPDEYVVDNDHVQIAFQALDHLWLQGYRRPVALLADRRRSYTRDIATAFGAWSSRHQRPAEVVDIPTNTTARQLMLALLTRPDPADAIYAGTEDIALEVLHSAAKLGVSVPDQLGLISCVGSTMFMRTSPEVTCVFNHPRRIGKQAVSLLISLLEGDGPQPARIAIPTELQIRESSTRKRTKRQQPPRLQ